MKTSFLLIAMLILGFVSQAQSMKPDRDGRAAEIKKSKPWKWPSSQRN